MQRMSSAFTGCKSVHCISHTTLQVLNKRDTIENSIILNMYTGDT